MFILTTRFAIYYLFTFNYSLSASDDIIASLTRSEHELAVSICFISIISISIFRLHSDWSVKTATINQWKQPAPLNANEHKKIVDVIQKAEAMEHAEQKRVG